jgi:hypothetical protein
LTSSKNNFIIDDAVVSDEGIESVFVSISYGNNLKFNDAEK